MFLEGGVGGIQVTLIANLNAILHTVYELFVRTSYIEKKCTFMYSCQKMQLTLYINITHFFYIPFSFKLSSVYSPINCYHEDYNLNYFFEYDYVGDHFELSLSELADI